MTPTHKRGISAAGPNTRFQVKPAVAITMRRARPVLLTVPASVIRSPPTPTSESNVVCVSAGFPDRNAVIATPLCGSRGAAKREPLRPPHEERVDARDAAIRALEPSQLGNERLEYDARLEPRERRPEAEVFAEAEAREAREIAIEREPVGLVEAALVAIGRAQEHRDIAAARDAHAADLGIRGRRAKHDLHGRVVAEPLLDERGDERRIARYGVQHVAVLEQRLGEVPDQVGGGLVAGHEQQQDELDHLSVGECDLALLLGEDQADQIVARVRAALA